jgi:hypothetical protein
MDFGEQARDGPIKHSCVWCPSGSFLTCREIVLTSNVGYPCKDRVHWRFEDGTEAPPRDRSPKRQGDPPPHIRAALRQSRGFDAHC